MGNVLQNLLIYCFALFLFLSFVLDSVATFHNLAASTLKLGFATFSLCDYDSFSFFLDDQQGSDVIEYIRLLS